MLNRLLVFQRFRRLIVNVPEMPHLDALIGPVGDGCAVRNSKWVPAKDIWTGKLTIGFRVE
jgi:hypothetical protein